MSPVRRTSSSTCCSNPRPPGRRPISPSRSTPSGGELNAFTAREQTCYYAHVLDSDLELAIDLVADVVLRGRCASDDVEVERDVVLEEIAMRDDDPEDLLGRPSWVRCSVIIRSAAACWAAPNRFRR